MNWRLKLVLLFTNLVEPMPGVREHVSVLRKKANASARLGSRVFDRKVKVTKVTDTDADGIPLRIYQNNTATNQRVIIYYHGGGFVLYGLDSHDCVCRRLCAMNDCIVVSVDYRLAPEHTFPAGHEDAFAAIQWVRANIHNYGGNPLDIVVAGDSAGGNLSACMAHRCRKERIPLTAQILIYPWIDGKLSNASIHRNGKGYLLTEESVHWFQEQYTPRVEDRLVPSISPCYETEFAGLAPALVLTAQYDPLLDDGRKYHEQLTAAGVPSQYKEYVGLIHGFINIPRVDANAMGAFSDIRDFLKGVKAPQPKQSKGWQKYDIEEIKKKFYELAKKIDAPEKCLPGFGSFFVERPYFELDRVKDIHYIYKERGELVFDEVAYNVEGLIDIELDKLFYKAFVSVTFHLSYSDTIKESGDHRPIRFDRQERLMATLKPEWGERLKLEHEEILKRSPAQE